MLAVQSLRVIGTIFTSWVVTLPAGAILSFFSMYLGRYLPFKVSLSDSHLNRYASHERLVAKRIVAPWTTG